MVGLMSIGILLGFIAGGFALVSGYSILLALLVYSAIGVCSTLITLLAAYGYCAFLRRKSGPLSYSS